MVFLCLVCVILLIFYYEVYGMGRVSDGMYGGVQVGGSQIWFFCFGDFFQLFMGDFVDFFGVWVFGV